MSTGENKAMVRRFIEEVFNQRNVDAIDTFMSSDYVDHVVPPGVPPTREGFKQFVGMFLPAFPDFQYTLEDDIAEGDRVMQRLSASGTQQGEFMGIPATGKHATWSEIHVGRVADGKIVEHWGTIDQLGMLQQLGVIPPPGQPG